MSHRSRLFWGLSSIHVSPFQVPDTLFHQIQDGGGAKVTGHCPLHPPHSPIDPVCYGLGQSVAADTQRTD